MNTQRLTSTYYDWTHGWHGFVIPCLLVAVFSILLVACGREMTPDEIAAAERARWQHTSIPENVAANPKWRALLPPNATYHPYPGLQMKDSWSVPDSIHDVAAFYRKTMPQEGFTSERLVECLNKSIWGGPVMEIQYCSSSVASRVTLGGDTRNRVTAIEVTYAPPAEDRECRTEPGPPQSPGNWFESCPANLSP
jgi:hypothetical protein